MARKCGQKDGEGRECHQKKSKTKTKTKSSDEK